MSNGTDSARLIGLGDSGLDLLRTAIGICAHAFDCAPLVHLFARDFVVIVPERQNGMIQHHARSRIAHHTAHPLAHVGLVTVNGTLGAGWLVIHKWAFGNPLHRIIGQFRTLGA